MTEERITETRDDAGNTHTTHTVVHDDAPRRSGGGMIFLIILIAILAVGAFLIFNQTRNSEMAANEAVTDAANSVGDAANSAGEAIDNAADQMDGE